MTGARDPWPAVDDVPESTRTLVLDYIQFFGRDAAVVWAAFLGAANSPETIDAAIRRLKPARGKAIRGSEAVADGIVITARSNAGWAALHQLFPKDQEAWRAHWLERSHKLREEELTLQGADLFKEVLGCLRSHYYFEKDWHYTICSLFIMQGWVARAGALPAVFYLYFGGSMSSGKSSVLFLVASLTDGIMLENVSPSALARVIGDGRTVLLDEFDVERGEELDDVMASLLRSGYRRNGPPYVRWNAKDKKAEALSIFGPKSGTFRSALDPALQSRGFVIPTAKPIGEEHFGLILAGWWPKTGELVPRLQKWGEWASTVWKSDKLETLARSPEFQAKLRTIVGQLGANRESELLTLALLVAEMVPVDVVDSLASARELRAVEISEDQAEAIDELRSAVLSVAAKTITFTADGREVFRVVQKSVRDHMNLGRKQRGDRPITTGRLALLRRELGVSDSWLVESGHRVVWNLSSSFLELLRKQDAESSASAGGSPARTPPAGGSLSPPYLPSYSPPPLVLPPDSADGRREQGSTKGVPGGGSVPERPSSTGAGLPVPEESFMGRTRADRAREQEAATREWRSRHPDAPPYIEYPNGDVADRRTGTVVWKDGDPMDRRPPRDQLGGVGA